MMHTLGMIVAAVGILAAAPAVALAQGDSSAQMPQPTGAARLAQPDSTTSIFPAIRRIESASSVSKEQIGTITSVRELPDGRVLVNDGARRRLLLLDTAMTAAGVVLDSLAELENTYGTRPGILIPYRGDSTLFIDPASYVIIVLDPQAKIARVRSVWSVRDLEALGGGGWGGGGGGRFAGGGRFGFPFAFGGGGRGPGAAAVGTDARGRVVFQVPAESDLPRTSRTSRASRERGAPAMPTPPDSAFIVAVDMDARQRDTLGVIRIPKREMVVRATPNGGFDFRERINPLPASDDWTVLPDGVVAFVRGRDYRVEYLHGDGSWTSSPKLPFEWERLTEEDRGRLVDSVRTIQDRMYRTMYVTSMIRWVNMHGRQYPEGFAAPEGYRLPQGFGRDWRLPAGVTFPEAYVHGCAKGEEATMVGDRPSCIPTPVAEREVPSMPVMREIDVVDPAALPDFRPPLSNVGATMADADGNLWIRATRSSPVRGGPVYDVISREGKLVDRIQVPPGYTLVGFGRGRVVYLSTRGGDGPQLARVQLR